MENPGITITFSPWKPPVLQPHLFQFALPLHPNLLPNLDAVSKTSCIGFSTNLPATRSTRTFAAPIATTSPSDAPLPHVGVCWYPNNPAVKLAGSPAICPVECKNPCPVKPLYSSLTCPACCHVSGISAGSTTTSALTSSCAKPSMTMFTSVPSVQRRMALLIRIPIMTCMVMSGDERYRSTPPFVSAMAVNLWRRRACQMSSAPLRATPRRKKGG